METKIYDVRGKELNEAKDLDEAAEILRNGGIVAFPTETVYGLGADAFDSAAVNKIYKAKGRPSDNPMIVHISHVDDLDLLTDEVGDEIRLLAKSFWPGPLTMILNKKASVPDVTTGGLDTVAVRMPDSKVALELIKKTGRVLAAPSANISGRPSPTKGKHVIEDLLGRIDGIIIGEDCRVGIESTVLDMTTSSPIILRPGIITKEMLSQVLGKEVRDQEVESQVTKSPGTKYAHYSPKAEMLLLIGERESTLKKLEEIRREKTGVKLGVLDMGAEKPEKAAKVFFNELRKMDEEGVDLIVAIGPREEAEGLALLNRMIKASNNNIIRL